MAVATITPGYTFDDFVEGEENRTAIATLRKVVSQPGLESLNPLLLCGPSNTGKSHLLQAVMQEWSRPPIRRKWRFFPAGLFIQECDQAWQERRVSEFRCDMWTYEILVIDDIHLLANRPAALDELYHMYNRFIADGKQLLFSSRYLPGELLDFPAPMRNRLLGGLIVTLNASSPELLQAIVEFRCQQVGLRLTRKALKFLCKDASHPRELNGLLHEVLATSTDRRLSLEQVQAYYQRHELQPLSIDSITRCVCRHFQVDLQEVRSASRQQNLVLARQIAMYLIRQLTSASLSDIGHYFSGRDHSTVLYAYRKLVEELEQTPHLKRTIQQIQEELRA